MNREKRASPRRRDPPHPRSRRRARLCPPRAACPPRHQAGEHPAPGGSRRRRRLRHRRAPSKAGRARERDDRCRPGHRHAGVHEPGAGDRRARPRRPQRSLFAGLRPLRDARRRGAVHRATVEAILVQRFTQPPPEGHAEAARRVPQPSRRRLHRAWRATPRTGSPPWRAFVDVARVEDRGAGSELERSIAVLPFANMSGDPENEYFCDGIAEEIINALAQLPRPAGGRPHLGVLVQGQERRPPQHRRAAQRRHRARGKRAARRRPHPHHRAAHQRRRRLPPLVRALRPGARRTSSPFRTRSPRRSPEN